MGTAFDKIAKTTTTKAAASKIAAEVNPVIQKAVDTIINTKAAIAKLEAKKLECEAAVIDHVRPQQDRLARNGSFTKSLTVDGINGALTYVTQDRFTVPQDEPAQTSLKTLLGKTFETFFETKRSISIKDKVLKDEKTLNKLVKACEAAKLDISEIFDVGDKVIAKDDLDLKQYSLDDKDLEVFRSLVKQVKPSLR